MQLEINAAFRSLRTDPHFHRKDLSLEENLMQGPCFTAAKILFLPVHELGLDPDCFLDQKVGSTSGWLPIPADKIFLNRENISEVSHPTRDVMAVHQSNIVALAHKISALSEKLGQSYVDTGAPEPSFEPNSAGVPESEEYRSLRVSLNDAVNDLTLLVNGPQHTLCTFLLTFFDLAAFQTALEFGFFEAWPAGETINVSNLAEKVGINQDHVGRVLRILATHRVFVESEPDSFGHTSLSALLARESDIRATAHMELGSSCLGQGVMCWPYLGWMICSEQLLRCRTAFGMKSTTMRTMRGRLGLVCHFGNITKKIRSRPQGLLRPWRAWLVVSLFTFPNFREQHWICVGTLVDRQVSELVEGFPWATLAERSKVVDCGGGSGHASFVLAQVRPLNLYILKYVESHKIQIPNRAKKFSTLEFIVQDISTKMMGHEHNQSELDGRIVFMKHDYFEPQPVQDASVYFIRQCIHNWDDAGAIKILKAFVPALERCRAGTPLLINDTILPKPGSITRYEERNLRQFDIAMLLQLGAKQRTVEDFRKILKQADERYHVSDLLVQPVVLKKMHILNGRCVLLCRLLKSTIEVQWDFWRFICYLLVQSDEWYFEESHKLLGGFLLELTYCKAHLL